MKVMVCLDLNNGMQFNHRRQSRDRTVTQRMLELAGDSPIWLTKDSARLFDTEEAGRRLRLSEQPLKDAGPGEFCFVEQPGLLPFRDTLEEIIVFRWDRVYPADQICDLKPEPPEWRLDSTCEWKGYSHEKITQEVYHR